MLGGNADMQSDGTYMGGAKAMADSDEESEMVRKFEDDDDSHKINKVESMMGFDEEPQAKGSIYAKVKGDFD